MNELSRRNAMKMLAGGTVLASGAALAASPAGARDSAATPAPEAAAATMSDAAWRVATTDTPPATSPMILATVARCRSWDGTVYFTDGQKLCGYAQLTPQAFAIAAACQAANRPVAMRYTEHDPLWAGGSGFFAGVVLAIDPRDLAPAGERPWE